MEETTVREQTVNFDHTTKTGVKTAAETEVSSAASTNTAPMDLGRNEGKAVAPENLQQRHFEDHHGNHEGPEKQDQSSSSSSDDHDSSPPKRKEGEGALPSSPASKRQRVVVDLMEEESESMETAAELQTDELTAEQELSAILSRLSARYLRDYIAALLDNSDIKDVVQQLLCSKLRDGLGRSLTCSRCGQNYYEKEETWCVASGYGKMGELLGVFCTLQPHLPFKD